MGRSRTALAALLWLLAGCRGPIEGSASTREGPREASAVIDEGPGWPSWGARVPSLAPDGALEAELARDPAAPELRALIASTGEDTRAGRERGLWSLARIGGAASATRLLAELDGGDNLALAAAALLEAPRAEAGGPPEPSDGPLGPWAALEDALWTRYAVTDPAALGQQRALLLAIARVGGSRSIARLAVDLAELPGPDHGVEVSGRWSAAMNALGIACARGLALDEAAAAALAGGLQQRVDVDPAVPEAALFALSRCARSSGELLVESRELLVDRLTAHVEAPVNDDHARLAWRGFAALGELPAAIPATILGPAAAAPAWVVEVEAVRALGGSPRGSQILRTRLAASSFAAFAGPRQHVLLASLQAMRADISSALEDADEALATIEAQLLAARRSEDRRQRKLAALGLCELRLLQAIRSGQTSSLERCHELSGAPEVELPLGLRVNLEVEALLRATRVEAPPTGELGTTTADDAAVIADQPEESAADPGRRARVGRLLQLARDADAARAAPALHALAELDDPGAAPVLRAALTSADPGILAAAATAVAIRSVDASKRDLEVVPLLEQVVTQRTGAADVEGRLAAIEGLGALARSAVANVDPTGATTTVAPPSPWLERTVVPLALDANVAVRARAREALLGHDPLLARFDQRAGAPTPSPFPELLATQLAQTRSRPAIGLRVRTSAGDFTIDLRGVEAPINQANLVALTESKFYDGLGFHRIVPGFVVQGGDPRGDGYGGPGYVVPCEWSNLRYERGTVGIALAGKDTGGSQLFVTQTRQPHLDARYTVIGQVSEGLAVIDLLLPGDRIEAVEVLYEASETQ